MTTTTVFEREIVELHQFFMDWFNSKLENTDAEFARFADTVGPDFHIVSPSGQLTDRETLLTQLRGAYGARPGAKLWIENAALRTQIGDIAIVTYEEWQTNNRETTSRMSTAVFQKTATAPNGLLWLHVHETWFERK